MVRRDGSRMGFSDDLKSSRNGGDGFEHCNFGKNADRSFCVAGQGRGFRLPHGYEAAVDRFRGDRNGAEMGWKRR